MKENSQQHNEIVFRDYRKFNQENFLSDMAIEFSSIPEKWENFSEKFIAISNKHAPLVKRRIKQNNQEPWIDTDLAKLFHDRDYAKYMSNHTNEPDWERKYRYLQKTSYDKLKEKNLIIIMKLTNCQKIHRKNSGQE